MAEMQILTTLKRKRDDIERTITAYEGKIAACRRDLAHVIGVLALFEASGEPSELGAHVSIVRLFKRGEVFAICRKALEAAPDGLDTRELALAVIGQGPRRGRCGHAEGRRAVDHQRDVRAGKADEGGERGKTKGR